MSQEITAMQLISDTLEKLGEDERSRVLTWAMSRFCAPAANADPTHSGTKDNPQKPTDDAFSEFADLYYAASPKDHGEKALTASYWLSLENGGQSFPSQDVNSLLKNLGFAVPNITDALNQCLREKPATIIQTRKNGTTRQGRKLYKITDAGVRRVQSMTARGNQ
ncbi:hypothetical protein EPK99_17835 [Neorhizobium lilium]|uniref:Uncharacterized protein n=1 Tax=Neorhizobium lilium TaxID=2503024 RepID=A0A3S3RQP6_9HYPH|nr:hypothetical protein [Neorhizobium lilium]RWX75560.1 hypothetical protein EPK99_17835 [Neorhizobium lilium]